jgi:hypothetical protein
MLDQRTRNRRVSPSSTVERYISRLRREADARHEHATFETGGNSLEAGLMEMNDRMRGGRVFKRRNEGWLEEYRLYHRREDGRVVTEGDDAISASRYAMMARRWGSDGADDAEFQRTNRISTKGLSLMQAVIQIRAPRGDDPGEVASVEY